MSMTWVQKALDTVVGANLIPQDLSKTITLADGRPRPFLQNAPQSDAKALTHEWDEQSLIGVGTGAASYQDGNQPPVDAQAAARKNNLCCRIGKTASVTEDMIAAFIVNGQLADGVLESKVGGALDYQKELKTREVLDEMEWMHISGDRTITAGFPGGQTDGLEKWALANGQVYTPATATNVAPVTFVEDHIRAVMRNIALTNPSALPTEMLIAPELKPDMNKFQGAGAGNPIVRIISNDTPTQDLIGGSPEVTKYDTGFGVVNVRVEPNLSPTYNPLKSGQVYQNVLLYNKELVKNASLRKLNAKDYAVVATSIQCGISTTFCQEQRLAKHTGVIKFVKSSVV